MGTNFAEERIFERIYFRGFSQKWEKSAKFNPVKVDSFVVNINFCEPP